MSTQSLHNRNFLLHLQERAGYDQPVLLKEPTHKIQAKSHIDQLHNEFVITSQLADVPGIRSVHGKEGTEGRPVFLLEYYNRLDEYEFQKLIFILTIQ